MSKDNLKYVNKRSILTSQTSNEPTTACSVGDKRSQMKRQNSMRSVKIVPIDPKRRSVSPKFEEIYHNYGPKTKTSNMNSLCSSNIDSSSSGLPPKPKYLKINSMENHVKGLQNKQFPVYERETPKYEVSEGSALAKLQVKKKIEKSSSVQVPQNTLTSVPFACISNRNNPKRFTKEKKHVKSQNCEERENKPERHGRGRAQTIKVDLNEVSSSPIISHAGEENY